MKEYIKYVDSGVEWIGSIPIEWNVDKITSLYTERNTKVSDKEFPALSVTKKGILPQLETVAKTNNNDDRKLVKQGDFVINSRADRRGACGISPDDGSVSLINTVLNPLKDTHKLYYNYVFRSVHFSDEFFRWGSGIHNDLWSTKWNKMRNIFIPIPTMEEQKNIADYLYGFTKSMDNLVTDKERLIELLKEKRKAIINEAVTKGLDKNIRMKDSGIEWIGAIPKHWNTKHFRHLFSFSRGLSITKADLLDEGIPCVSYGEIHSKYGFEVNPEVDELKHVDKGYLQSSQLSLLKRGDFVFADTSEDIDGSGNFTCLNSDIQIFAGYHSVIVRQKEKHYYRYLSYLFDSIGFRAQIRSKVYGIKVFSITQSILKNILVLLPPNDEQKQIAKYLDIKVSKIENGISDIQIQIEKLKEYRQSIISEVVTGKVAI